MTEGGEGGEGRWQGGMKGIQKSARIPTLRQDQLQVALHHPEDTYHPSQLQPTLSRPPPLRTAHTHTHKTKAADTTKQSKERDTACREPTDGKRERRREEGETEVCEKQRERERERERGRERERSIRVFSAVPFKKHGFLPAS